MAFCAIKVRKSHGKLCFLGLPFRLSPCRAIHHTEAPLAGVGGLFYGYHPLCTAAVFQYVFRPSVETSVVGPMVRTEGWNF